MKDARFAPYVPPTSSSSPSPSSSSSSASTPASASASSSSSSASVPSASTSISTSVLTAVDQTTQHGAPSETLVHQALRAMLERDPQPRGWERLVQHGRGACLSIVSYNLLSNTLARTSGKYGRNIHIPDPLQWQSRMALLLREIKDTNAEVLCVQELDQVDYDGPFSVAMGRLGYRGTFQKRRMDQEYGFALFYRHNRITLVNSFSVPCPEGDVITDVEYAGILAILDIADADGGNKPRRVCVATTHVVCTHTRGFAKLAQVMALISAAKVLMRRNGCMPFSDMNAVAGSLITEFIVRGSVDLSTMPECEFSKEPLGRPLSAITQTHLARVRAFKRETQVLRDIVSPKAFAYPRPRCPQRWTMDPRDLAAPVSTAYAPKVEELRFMIKTQKDAENGVVAHPLHLSSVYDVPNIPDYIFH
ncbi:hypothetical protein BGZ72_001854, partial [Mortierella alpina]